MNKEKKNELAGIVKNVFDVINNELVIFGKQSELISQAKKMLTFVNNELLKEEENEMENSKVRKLKS